jgi:hypothetical protein
MPVIVRVPPLSRPPILQPKDTCRYVWRDVLSIWNIDRFLGVRIEKYLNGIIAITKSPVVKRPLDLIVGFLFSYF